MFTHFAGEVCVSQICADLAHTLNLWVITQQQEVQSSPRLYIKIQWYC